MSGGGGQALVGKWGRVPKYQIFANWGDPPSPPTPQEKNPGTYGEKLLDITSILEVGYSSTVTLFTAW